jgi:hypothetical protein
MQIETSLTMPNKVYRKNTLDIDVHVNVDLTNYSIKAEIFDRFYSSLLLQTANRPGGADNQIKITGATNGNFTIHIATDKTTLFHLISYLEVTIIDPDGNEQTAWFGMIKFEDNIFLRAYSY